MGHQDSEASKEEDQEEAMSLKALHVQGFQRHDDLTIELSPGVTTIVGESDTGKSSVLRALRWLFLNQPRGEAFIRDGSKKATVTLAIGKREVSRARGKGGNHYFLDGEKYTAFGNNVPKEIQEVLNISELNFQGQHDSPFWFSLSPGEVSKRLNAIVDLSLMDDTLKRLSSSIRSSRSELGIVEERIASAKRERSHLKWVKEASQDLQKVEKASEQVDQIAGQVEALGGILRSAESTQERLAILKGSREALKELEALEESYATHDKGRERVETLTRLLDEVATIRGDVKEARLVHHETQEKLSKEMGEVCPLCGAKATKL